jgi:cobalamin biosynthesis Mg chelatase CobN
MTAPSHIDLVNSALISIGQEPIVALEDADYMSPVVVAVKDKTDLVRRELLRSNDWNCARTTAKLAEVLMDNNYTGWKHVFQLPADPECLRVVQISVDGRQTYIDLDDYYNYNRGPREALFDIDGKQILSNSPEIYIKYTADIDPAKFDSVLAPAFVAMLAAELSYCLPASVSLSEYMTKVARQKLKSAKSLNARERNIHRPEGEVINVRYGYSDRHLRVDMSDELD